MNMKKKTKAPFINKRNEELLRPRGNYGKLPLKSIRIQQTSH